MSKFIVHISQANTEHNACFQVTISYIDEDLSYEERQASLADYGFECRCSKCLDEKAKLS